MCWASSPMLCTCHIAYQCLCATVQCVLVTDLEHHYRPHYLNTRNYLLLEVILLDISSWTMNSMQCLRSPAGSHTARVPTLRASRGITSSWRVRSASELGSSARTVRIPPNPEQQASGAVIQCCTVPQQQVQLVLLLLLYGPSLLQARQHANTCQKALPYSNKSITLLRHVCNLAGQPGSDCN
jgi:hypothetical protein